METEEKKLPQNKGESGEAQERTDIPEITGRGTGVSKSRKVRIKEKMSSMEDQKRRAN